MENLLTEKLYRASARTFEDLAFLLPAEKMGEEQSSLPVEHGVMVRFKGPFAGHLVLKVSKDLPAALAANMLGEEGPSSEIAQKDALKEAANVICGNLLPTIAGPQAVFHLNPPEVTAIAPSANTVPVARIELGIEAGRCEVEFYADGAVA